MNLKYKIIMTIVILAGAFAAGRYSVNTTPTVSQKTIEVEHKQETIDKDVHKTIVRVKEPSGKVTTTVNIDNTTHEKDNTTDQVNTDLQVTPPKRETLNISALVGVAFNGFRPVYGASISKEFLGPVPIGVYGLSNGVIGLSLGFNF